MADSGQQQAPSSAKTPADFLKSIKGKPVIVKLNSGVDYRGGEPALHRRRAAAAASAGGADEQEVCGSRFALLASAPALQPAV